MWLFLPYGFYSIGEREPTTTQITGLYSKGSLVNDFEYSNQFLCVRTRDKQSLNKMIEDFDRQSFGIPHTNICENDGTDYEYRMWVDRNQFGLFLSSVVKEINYPKFKSECPPYLYNIFLRVWSVLCSLNDNSSKQLGLWQ